MSIKVCTGATAMCTMGATPCVFTATPRTVLTSGSPVGNIGDFSLINMATFGMCSSPTNPDVADATTKAGGTLTPMPCLPVIATPWTVGAPTVLVNGMPALNNSSVNTCTWGGVISITIPGQIQVLAT